MRSPQLVEKPSCKEFHRPQAVESIFILSFPAACTSEMTLLAQDGPTFPFGIEAHLACHLSQKSGTATFLTVTGDRVCGPLWERQAQPWLEEAAPEVSAVEASPVEASPVEESPVEASSWRAAASSSTAARRESSWV